MSKKRKNPKPPMGEIIEIILLLDLEKFKEHRRLQTFYHKGCQCVVPRCNLVLNKKHIEYEYGFTSDSTQKVFKTGMENLK